MALGGNISRIFEIWTNGEACIERENHEIIPDLFEGVSNLNLPIPAHSSLNNEQRLNKCAGLVFTVSAIVQKGSKSALIKCYLGARNVIFVPKMVSFQKFDMTCEYLVCARAACCQWCSRKFLYWHVICIFFFLLAVEIKSYINFANVLDVIISKDHPTESKKMHTCFTWTNIPPTKYVIQIFVLIQRSFASMKGKLR